MRTVFQEHIYCTKRTFDESYEMHGLGDECMSDWVYERSIDVVYN